MEDSVIFPTNTSFSLRCGKCADIHNAQLEGKQDKPCECGCHTTYQPPYNPYPDTTPIPPWQNPVYCQNTSDGLIQGKNLAVEQPREKDYWFAYNHQAVPIDHNYEAVSRGPDRQ